MSHRRQTPEEHFAKTHRRMYNQQEMARRFEQTQKRKAKDAIQKASAASMWGRFSRFFSGTKSDEKSSITVKGAEDKPSIQVKE